MSTSSWFFFRTEENWKLCVRTCAADSVSGSDTEWPGLKPVCQHSNTKHQAFVRFFRKQRHKSMCKFPATIILFFRVFISAPLRVTRLLRAGRCLVAYVLGNGVILPDFIIQVPLELSSRGPALSSVCLHMCWSYQSLLSQGYLILPSLFTGPSSDLGSGDKELQDVLEQSSAAGQEEVSVAHTLFVTQKVPTLLSTHSSRGWPTSWALRWASCMADSWGGSCSTELSCW